MRVLRGQEIPFQNLGPNGSPSLKTMQWLKMWLSAKQVAVKASTLSNYRWIVERRFTGLSKYPLYALTPAEIQSYYHYMLQNNISASELFRIHKVFNQALKEAVRKGILLSNPASGVSLPPRPTHEAMAFDLHQQRRLVAASYHKPYGLCIPFLLSTGLRLGELLALHWADIDFSKKMLYVRYTRSGAGTILSTPKTPNAVRSIPLPKIMAEELSAWKEMQAPESPCTLIFADGSGKPLSDGKLRHTYNKLLSECNLPHYTLHTLRHTFATRALEVGMDYKTLSVILGHSSVAFTMDVYTHCSDEHKQRAMKLMDYEWLESPSEQCRNDEDSPITQLEKLPEIITKEQLRKVCHISKQTAKALLESGEIPCMITGKRTWRYQIRKQDVRKYLKKHANKYK